MNLKNSRIIVVDDNQKDVKKLLAFFDKEGVPYNYYEGTSSKKLPRKPLKDVRIIFLDFDLGTAGQFSIKNKISVLVGAFKKLLSKDNGPYVLIAWTTNNNTNQDLITPFKDVLMNDLSLPRPVMIFDMDKTNVMNDIRAIEKNVKKAFDGSNVFELLLTWGNHADTAISHVLSNLLNISAKRLPTTITNFSDYALELNKAMQFHMYKFAVSALGSDNVKPNKEMLVAGQLPFINFFQDFIENTIKEYKHNFSNLEKSTHLLNTTPPITLYTVFERAELNSTFLLSSKPEKFPQPGNIYIADDVFNILSNRRRNNLINKTIPKKSDLISDFLQRPKGQYRSLFMRRAKKILIEITPECDFAQNHWKSARLMLGVLIPYDLQTTADPESFLKTSGKVTSYLPIIYKKKTFLMTFHNIYQYNLGIEDLKRVSPVMRARKEFLVDIQHWFGTHISRPGKTEF